MSNALTVTENVDSIDHRKLLSTREQIIAQNKCFIELPVDRTREDFYLQYRTAWNVAVHLQI